MRKVLFLLVAFLLIGAQAMAADKFAVINMQEVIFKSEPGQKATDKLKKSFEGMKNDLDKQKNEIEKMRDALQKQSLVLSQEAKLDKENEFKKRVRDFQDSYQNYQNKMKVEEEKLSKPIMEMLVEVVGEFGKKNNYTMIFDRLSSGILHADKALDVTPQIITDLNRLAKEREKNPPKPKADKK